MKKKLEAQAAILRSKNNWASHSERPTKYFLNLEKKRALEKQISAIEREDGSLATELREVMKAIQTFIRIYILAQIGSHMNISFMMFLIDPRSHSFRIDRE